MSDAIFGEKMMVTATQHATSVCQSRAVSLARRSETQRTETSKSRDQDLTSHTFISQKKTGEQQRLLEAARELTRAVYAHKFFYSIAISLALSLENDRQLVLGLSPARSSHRSNLPRLPTRPPRVVCVRFTQWPVESLAQSHSPSDHLLSSHGIHGV